MSPEPYEWWNAPARTSQAEEIGSACKHCGSTVRGGQTVKQCPECRVVLHASCYEDTEGGRAYQTEGCESCRHRCYWR